MQQRPRHMPLELLYRVFGSGQEAHRLKEHGRMALGARESNPPWESVPFCRFSSRVSKPIMIVASSSRTLWLVLGQSRAKTHCHKPNDSQETGRISTFPNWQFVALGVPKNATPLVNNDRRQVSSFGNFEPGPARWSQAWECCGFVIVFGM